MKSTLKFMLALGSAKLVMVERSGQSSFYSKAMQSPSVRKTDLKKIAYSLSANR